MSEITPPRCAQCKSERKRSSVRQTGRARFRGAEMEVYRDGEQVITYRQNTTTLTYKCSRGHSWHVTEDQP